MIIEKARFEDLEEILGLQKIAYICEAEIYNDYTIPPLLQTLDELKKEWDNCVILKAVFEYKIVGSVRAFEKNGTCYIGKLIVHPNYQNRGIGKKLIAEIESNFSGCIYELFTGYRSEKNLYLYEKLGYTPFKTEKINDSLSLVFMHK